ncbi:hypothetical protein PVAP13_2KG168748 [Panicum virgatum]|uniref:Uncharacterized protein n=1 Tax=Panicum virgatum TaxID=38727 RepID=A0A8T0VWL4_PANVG|nr:hypothetical protein PVAP13_2KG168748 [Panicum virgatum]
MLGGIGPSKLLSLASSTDKPVRFPMENGMTPVSRLLVKSISSRLAKFPISDEIKPDM